ncbi:nitrogenase-stabilizing/protective protein NifW [Bradyrhizobium sp. DOA9]|nr:nitrogenase-stabilizing/protective protein NifW [Bradyrhizobium sp. DOA9]
MVQLSKAASAEDSFALFDVDYDPKVVNLARYSRTNGSVSR